MSKVRCHISVSLDGFVAGPNQSGVNPLGEGGEQLHGWAFGPTASMVVRSTRAPGSSRNHARTSAPR
jgi:hypothetical protein